MNFAFYTKNVMGSLFQVDNPLSLLAMIKKLSSVDESMEVGKVSS